MLEMIAGASMLGSVISALGGMQSAQAQEKAYGYNSQVAQQDAQFAVTSANDQANLIVYRGTRQVNSMKANYGASGVRIDSGSPLTAEAEGLFNVYRDASRVQYAGQVQSVADLNKSALDQYYAAQTQKASYYNLFGSLLSGGGRAGSLLAPGAATDASTTIVDANAYKGSSTSLPGGWLQ